MARARKRTKQPSPKTARRRIPGSICSSTAISRSSPDRPVPRKGGASKVRLTGATQAAERGERPTAVDAVVVGASRYARSRPETSTATFLAQRLLPPLAKGAGGARHYEEHDLPT